MCDDHPADRGPSAATMSRRSLLAAVPLTLLVASSASAAPRPAPARSALGLTLPTGLSSTSMAMHLHGSDSEGTASWSRHVEMAGARGIDYIFPSDHDWRLEGTHLDQRRSFDFALGLKQWMTWKRTPSSVVGATVSVLRLTGANTAYGPKALTLRLNAPAGQTCGVFTVSTQNNLEGNVRGRHVSATVKLTGGVLQVGVLLSQHGEEQLRLTYRLGAVTPGDYLETPSRAVVSQAMDTATWTTFTLTPLVDIARLWPGIEAEDNSILELTLALESTGPGAEVLVPRLELPRDIVGLGNLTSRHAMLDRLRGQSAVGIGHALEYSWPKHPNHLNGYFGSGPEPLLSGANPSVQGYDVDPAAAIVAAGGVVSLNHPAGQGTTLSTASAQLTKARDTARKLIAQSLYGAQVIEVGYERRGGLGTESYLLQLAAMLWRDGWFYTANGVSDNHHGTEASWSVNSGVTHTWAATSDLAAQLVALRAGLAHVTMHADYRGLMWLSLDGAAMGSVAVNPDRAAAAGVSVVATDVPSGGHLTVYRGPVDYPGAAVSAADLEVVGTFSAADLQAGPVALAPTRGPSCHYLAVLRERDGDIVGFTNPVWDLESEHPSRPIPHDRRVIPT